MMKLTLLTPEGQPGAAAYFDEEGGTLGRAPANTLVLAGDANISQVHLAIESVNGNWVLKDLGDLLPVFHNGRPLGYGVRADLADGDQLRIGNFELKTELHALRPARSEPIPAPPQAVSQPPLFPPAVPLGDRPQASQPIRLDDDPFSFGDLPGPASKPVVAPVAQAVEIPPPPPAASVVDPFDFADLAPVAARPAQAVPVSTDPFADFAKPVPNVPAQPPAAQSQHATDPFNFADLAPVRQDTAAPLREALQRTHHDPFQPSAADPFESLQAGNRNSATPAAHNDGGGSLGSLLGGGTSTASLHPVGQADSLDSLFGLQAGSGADPLAPGGIFDRPVVPQADMMGLAPPPVSAPSTWGDHAPRSTAVCRCPCPAG
ncbi:FHA domain-containing protein [Chitinimonas arctica]|uniref:FHA domain-containing protein n=1 Tax=Chitinimonas arctica TaxID=2594795 RepID=A0A516SHA0_9NEIS|nr:FHA domain-containing protein [Chitinimonas arctica]QDQ27500.1 FHA domain-containing protein [Chitinimonas arctica]